MAEKKPVDDKKKDEKALDLDEMSKVSGGSLRRAPKVKTTDISESVKDRI